MKTERADGMYSIGLSLNSGITEEHLFEQRFITVAEVAQALSNPNPRATADYRCAVFVTGNHWGKDIPREVFGFVRFDLESDRLASISLWEV